MTFFVFMGAIGLVVVFVAIVSLRSTAVVWTLKVILAIEKLRMKDMWIAR
jgi:FtsH-binding integral membrane protein